MEELKKIHQKIAGTKISAIFPDRVSAKNLANTLQEIIVPPPDAITLFDLKDQGWQLEAYYPNAETTEIIKSQLKSAFERTPQHFTISNIPIRNWVELSQAALPPVYAGPFRIYGNHDRKRIAKGPFAIEIEAGEAFGTAHHATTRGCLKALRAVTQRQTFDKVLDMGCGSGLLAIAARRCLPNATIIASDIDPKAIAVAKANFHNNGTSKNIRTVLSNGLNHPMLRQPEKFDLIVANILAGPLIRLAKPIARASKAHTTLILSGLLTHEAAQVIATFNSAGFRLTRHQRSDGWSTLVLKRVSARTPQIRRKNRFP